MAEKITTTSSTQPKTNTNSTIATSSFSASTAGSKIQNISLTEIQNAVNKLSTYVQKVNNCGNCKNYTVHSTSCQTTTISTNWKTTTKTTYAQCYYNYTAYYNECSDSM